MKVAFYTLGCKVNQNETGAMEALFVAAGYTLVPPQAAADVFVVNSCTVTSGGDAKSRRALRRAKEQNPNVVTVLTGCFPQAFPQQAAPCADVVCGTTQRGRLVQLVEEYLATGEPVMAVEPHQKGEQYEEFSGSQLEGRTRAFIKIQDGCNRRCAYCIIPTARGPARSRSEEAVLAQLQALAAEGYAEVVLTGINLSSYGRDTGTDLAEIVEKAAGIEGLHRIRLGSLEPDLLTDEQIARFAAVPKFCRQFHLSLQSGCDALLRAMRRPYSTALFREKAAALRSAMPDASLTTDVIVGFPGETDEEFEDTLRLVERVRYDALFTFIFSPRSGRPAAEMPDPFTREQKQKRFDRLLELQNRISQEKHSAYVGKTMRVLVDGTDGDQLTARTDGGRLVRMPGDPQNVGSFRQVRIVDSTTWSLVGQMEEAE